MLEGNGADRIAMDPRARHDDGWCELCSCVGTWQRTFAARRTTTDRDAGLEEAAVLMEQRADEIEACGDMIAHTISRIYRDEAEKIRALKTTPTAASSEEGNG
nr:hypothetical protein 1.11 [Burkholderia phage Bups phi1]